MHPFPELLVDRTVATELQVAGRDMKMCILKLAKELKEPMMKEGRGDEPEQVRGPGRAADEM
jgi:hypothetical protein